VKVEYDSIEHRVTVAVNGTDVVAGFDLDNIGYSPTIQYAGFQLTKALPQAAGQMQVDNFAVTVPDDPPPGPADDPSPAHGAMGVDAEVDLAWAAGTDALLHNVYLGLSPEAMTFRGTATTTAFDPGTLAQHTTYYWRIDEAGEEGVTTGPVWSFRTTTAGFPGDFDADEDVDQEDFGILQACLGAFNIPVGQDCQPADLNGDTFVDLWDVQQFLQCVSGPEETARIDCLDP
jgi:hypothetical protein